MKLVRSAGALVGSLAVGLACSKSPRVVTRAVTLHAVASCEPGAGAFAQYQPLGDFQDTSPLPSLLLSDLGGDLSAIPDDTRELVVSISEPDQWRAHGFVPPSGAVDLLLLAYQSPCALSDSIDARAGAAMGAIDATDVLIAGGSATGAVPTTALVDLAKGTLRTLEAGLLVPRAQATVTAWSGGGVVAGGVRPDTGQTVASAEVFVTGAGDFDGQLVTLSEPRARHGAVALTNGQTLLVGGVGSDGSVLGSMEIVDASAHRAQTTRLAQLAAPRADPQVLRLASGEILVAGGVDGTGAPVPTLEWFASDGSASSRPTQTLVAGAHQAFVALDAGGALAVIAPATPTSGFQDVWVISADGALQAATPIDDVGDVRLFAGSDQAPVLWTGDRWLVWQPWVGAFAALAPALGSAGPTGDPIASPEPGLGVWLDGATVHALRFGTRGPYATSNVPLLATDTSATAPDRLVGQGATDIAFDPSMGLSLSAGATVVVTDATFSAFTLDADTPVGSGLAVVLHDDTTGADTVLDAASCGVAPGAVIHLERDGATVNVRTTAGGALATCGVGPSAGDRVGIGVRGEGGAASVIRNLTVVRR